MKSLAYQLQRVIAMAWLVIGQNNRALAVFDAMLIRWPEDAYALASRAHLHAQAGRLTAALADSERLLRKTPDDARAWFNRGYLLESSSRFEEALEAFRHSTTLSPKLDRAWYGQGMVLIRLQRFEEAAAALKRNTELQPMSPYGWYQLARVHVDRQEPEAAVRPSSGRPPPGPARLARRPAGGPDHVSPDQRAGAADQGQGRRRNAHALAAPPGDGPRGAGKGP